ncbi:unnamed protein product [Penicillium glandicola]
MAPTTTIHDLPTELIWEIAENLDALSRMHLRQSCVDMNKRIYPPTHKELIEIENTPYGYERGLFACANCIRLLPKEMFADNMTVQKRAKRGTGSITRFCLECGIHPVQSRPRYNAGDHIIVKGKMFVICPKCDGFKEGKKQKGKGQSECLDCWDLRSEFDQETATNERKILDNLAFPPLCVSYLLNSLCIFIPMYINRWIEEIKQLQVAMKCEEEYGSNQI